MSKSPFNGVWNKLDAFRPGLIRLLATDRKRGHPRALTDEEIASIKEHADAYIKYGRAYMQKDTYDTNPFYDAEAAR